MSNVQPDLDPICLTLTELFKKVDFLNNQPETKTWKKIPGDKELNGSDKKILEGILILAFIFVLPQRGVGQSRGYWNTRTTRGEWSKPHFTWFQKSVNIEVPK